MSECVIINVTDYMEWWAIDARNLAAEKFVPIPDSKRPTVLQPDRETAEKEAARLVAANPGSRFAVFECVGIVKARILGDNDQVKGVGPCNAVAPHWEEGTEL